MRRHNLAYETVQLGVGRPFDDHITAANIIDDLVVVLACASPLCQLSQSTTMRLQGNIATNLYRFHFAVTAIFAQTQQTSSSLFGWRRPTESGPIRSTQHVTRTHKMIFIKTSVRQMKMMDIQTLRAKMLLPASTLRVFAVRSGWEKYVWYFASDCIGFFARNFFNFYFVFFHFELFFARIHATVAPFIQCHRRLEPRRWHFLCARPWLMFRNAGPLRFWVRSKLMYTTDLCIDERAGDDNR